MLATTRLITCAVCGLLTAATGCNGTSNAGGDAAVTMEAASSDTLSPMPDAGPDVPNGDALSERTADATNLDGTFLPDVVPDSSDGVTPPVDAGLPTIPISVQSYPQGGGNFFAVAVTINGMTFNALLDTGSSGLRVFSSTQVGTPTGEDVPNTFGSGTLCGPTETGIVALGTIATPAPIAFQRVVTCNGGPDLMGQLASFGIQGILGVSLQADTPQDIYSPLEQLAAPYNSGFLIQSGGFGSLTGTITVGVTVSALPATFGSIGLMPDTRRSVGPPAWIDRPSVCFSIDGSPATPACNAALFDTGGNSAVIEDTAAPACVLASDQSLVSGTAFEAVAMDPTAPAGSPPAMDLTFTVGNPPMASMDYVQVTSSATDANLGIEVFFRYDIAYDDVAGRLALSPQL